MSGTATLPPVSQEDFLRKEITPEIVTKETSSEAFISFNVLLLLALGCSLATAMLETWVYSKKILLLHTLNISLWDTCLVCWSLWAKTLVLLLPVLAVGGLLVTRGWPKLGKSLVITGTLFSVGWLVMDMRLQGITGNHISDYVPHLVNIQAWQWGGDTSVIVWRLSRDLTVTVVGVVVACLVLRYIVHRFGAVFPKFSERWLIRAGVAGYLAVLMGIFPAIQLVDQPLVLERLYASMTTNALVFRPEFVPGAGATAFGENVDKEFREVGETAHQLLASPVPVANQYRITHQTPPNVIVIITESFRHNIIDPKTMPKIAGWAKQGLVCRKHYATANRSDLGTFALMYGRWPMSYHQTLDRNFPPELSEVFRNSDYETTLAASCTFSMGRMTEFMCEEYFDHFVVHDHHTHPDQLSKNLPGGYESWAKNDRRTLKFIRELLQDPPTQKPQFITSYLMSTHYSYDYPPEYEKFHSSMKRGTRKEDDARRQSIKREDLLHRYLNSAAFLDDELYKLVSSLDPEKNIVVLTGDHGESFYEDGYVTHNSLLSDIQSSVPLVIVGPGFSPQIIETPTSHVDVLPTLLHAINQKSPAKGNLSGVDLLKTPPEAILLGKMYRDSWDLMLVHQEGRLKVNIRNAAPDLRVLGFFDHFDRTVPALAHPISEVPLWKKRWLSLLNPGATNHETLPDE